MWLYPKFIIQNGKLLAGFKVRVEENQITQIEPTNKNPDPYILSAAFVNAHSHLEYWGLQNQVEEKDFWPWLSKLVTLKYDQDPRIVRQDTIQAAFENKQTGVGLIADHSDRPFSGEALAKAKLQGIIFQEVITIGRLDHLDRRLHQIRENAEKNREFFNEPVYLSPHSPYTVDPGTLRSFAQNSFPFSIHVAETKAENEFFKYGTGPIAALCEQRDFPLKPTGTSVFAYLEDLGVIRQDVQLIHCCDLSPKEIERAAQANISIAHCPRSNRRLGCPIAPVREMLDSGIQVGLGLDSPASSGPVDMFAEMRAAIELSIERGKPITPEEVWCMATWSGAASLAHENWDISLQSTASLIKIYINGCSSISDIIQKGTPDAIEWITRDE